MRPVEFEAKDIIEAGLSLQSEGRNVTGFAIRARIGGGRADRLIEVWKEYKATEAAVTAEPVVELPVELEEEVRGLSSALTERLFKIATELNDKAVRAAERRITEISRAAGENTAQAERELADASRIVEDLEESLEKLKTEYATSLDQINVLSKNEHQLELQLAQRQERLAGTQKQLESAEQRITEISRAAAEKNAQAEKEMTDALHIVEDLKKSLAELKTEYVKSLDQNKILSEKEHQQELQLAQLQERLAGTKKQLEASEQKISETTQEYEDTINKLRSQHISDIKEIKAGHENKESELNHRIDDAALKMNNMITAHEQLREEKALLAGEFKTLASQNKQLMKLLESTGNLHQNPKMTKHDKLKGE